MSFQASIDMSEYQVLWTKAIYSLSTISDTIRLHLSKERVVISSINSTKTSLLNISFNSKKFFKDFTLSPENDISILINSKPLALIFRNYRLGNEDIEFFRFTINESSSNKRINRSRNKLFIEIMARDNLKKNYSLNFVRCKDSSDLKIDKTYKELLLTQSDDLPSEDRINYVMVETSLLKNFLDMFPPAIEDFKIEVMKRTRKLNLVGFNKQHLLAGSKSATNRESQALRQPMSLTIGVSLSDILGDNFPENGSAGDEKLNIIFRLKDFKTYINLINSVNNTQQKTADFDIQNHHNHNAQNFVEILFNNPGFPVLLSRRCELPNIYSTRPITNTVDNINEEFELFKIELILISDFEGDNIQIQEKDLVIPNIEILKNDIDVGGSTTDSRQVPSLQMSDAAVQDPLFVTDEIAVPKNKPKAGPTNGRKFNLKSVLKETQQEANRTPGTQGNTDAQESHPPSVLWNDGDDDRDDVASAYISNQTGEYIRLNRENDQFDANYKRRQLLSPSGQDQEEDGVELGPTQGVFKVKGLFD